MGIGMRGARAAAVVATLWLATAARAADYWVKSGGSDGADGLSVATAWATLPHAADRVGPGDTVHVLDGGYQGFHLETSGTPGNPITFEAEGPSVPGQPPHTHKGTYLRRAVRWDADKTSAVIGPMASIVDQAGAVHEFGQVRLGTDYPERPFMLPALERALPRFAGQWQGSVGE